MEKKIQTQALLYSAEMALIYLFGCPINDQKKYIYYYILLNYDFTMILVLQFSFLFATSLTKLHPKMLKWM